MRLKLFNLNLLNKRKRKKLSKNNWVYGPITKYYTDKSGMLCFSVEEEKGKIKRIRFL